MDIEHIRKQVADAAANEEQTGRLFRLARASIRRDWPKLSLDEVDARSAMVVTFVRDFVTSLPDTIEMTLAAADAAGAADEVRPVFETALEYLDEEGDFIPDAMGLAGLVDDAYLVRELMQELSHRHRLATGEPLVPTDHKKENQMARRLIGEPTATRLDAAVIAFSRRKSVRETIDAIVKRVGAQRLSMSLPVSMAFGTGTGSGDAARDELPDLQLGQLGQG